MIPKTKEAKIILAVFATAFIFGLIINFYGIAFYSILAYNLSGPMVSLIKYSNLLENT